MNSCLTLCAMRQFVNVVISPLPSPLTYEVPEPFNVSLGHLVEVPLGRRTARGYVIESFQEGDRELPTEFAIKPITDVPLSSPSFLASQLEFFEWIATYYCEPLSIVLDNAIPPSAPPRYEKVHSLTGVEVPERAGKKQKEICRFLKQNGPTHYRELITRYPGSQKSLQGLEAQNVIHTDQKELKQSYIQHQAAPEWSHRDSLKLTAEQETALSSILPPLSANEFAPFLLHGVTGSGKTEIYIEAILQTLDLGKSALIVVPEISLTPQLVDRFRARLGNNIAVLHSGLSKRVRWDSWRALLENECQIAIGARSAVFAPLHNPGIVIVDEEHDSSFKQSDGFRYNARDLAIVRAKMSSCPVILGSATPSLESYYNAAKKRYTYLPVRNRHATHQSLDVEIIDLNSCKKADMPTRNMSKQLFDEITETLSKKQQVFILYNRRGFASYLQCESCGTPAECPNCSVTFTYHQSKNSLLCHYCGLTMVPPQYCEACTGEQAFAAAHSHQLVNQISESHGKYVPRGAGTEKIHEELRELFPEANIDRLDRDVSQSEKDYRMILDRMRTKETDILVGTQMIAKGHDLPHVTLVGVVDSDVGLHMPDFRASERTFQLLMQTAGRAGRGSDKGKVLLQTRIPEHISLMRTKDHDFKKFALEELQMRKAAFYPPFSKMLRVVSSSQDRNLAQSLLKRFREILEEDAGKQEAGSVLILGPTGAPLEKLKTQWRYHLIVKSDRIQHIHRTVRILKSIQLPSSKLRVTYDIDPQDML